MARTAHKPGAGRKQEYADSLFEAILHRYAEGENLKAILGEKGMPTWGAFYNRVMGPNAVPELLALHARARESWAEAKVVEAMHIADVPETGKKVRKGPDGTTTTTGDAVDARRLKVSTRQWFAERVLRRSYGAAQRVSHENPDGSALNVIPVINLTVVGAEPEKK